MVKQLDTSNVKTGVEVTYNELCEMIGVEPSSNRTYQYNKIFSRYMDIERIDTHLFIVKEIYSDPDVTSTRKYKDKIKREYLDKIAPGMMVKNYHALCDLLGLKYSTNMQQQFEIIRQYVDVEKIPGTRNYVIHKVYDREDVIRRVGRPRKHPEKEISNGYYKNSNHNVKTQGYNLSFGLNSKWQELFAHILINKCLESEKRELLIKTSDIPVLLGLRRENYSTVYDYYDYTECEELRSFNYWFEAMYSGIIQGSLYTGLGERNRVFNIFDTFFHNDGYNKPAHEATVQESKRVLAIMDSIAKEHGLRSYGNILWFGTRHNKYLSEINECVKEEFGWKYFWRCKSIIINPAIPDEALSRIKEYDPAVERMKANELLISKLRAKIQNKLQDKLDYHPNRNKVIIGEASDSTAKMYLYLCDELEKLIDAKVRITDK